MPYSAKFSMTLQIEILSTVTSDFLKQKLFSSHLNYSVLQVKSHEMSSLSDVYKATKQCTKIRLVE